MKKLTLTVTVLALCSLSFAQTLTETSNNPQQETTATDKKGSAGAVPDSPFATNECSYTFTSGANNTFLQYCVTVNGNIIQLQTAGHSQISALTAGEGYGLCDVTGGSVNYSDYGVGATANWNPATLVSLTGTSVKIARTTSDGIWTLTQTITQVASTSSIKVVMILKNNTTANRIVNFLRFADVDADAQRINNLDGTHNTAMAWTSTSAIQGFGLMLQNVGNSLFVYDAFAQNSPFWPIPCNYTAHFTPGVLTNTDGSLVLVYVTTVLAKGTRTFNMMYKGL